jgi:hypothetical protein
MKIRALMAGALALAFIVPAANAMTVYNTDKTAHTVIFTPAKGKPQHIALKAHAHRTLSCSAGGTLAMGKISETCTAKTAKVMIKNGKFAG